MGEYDNAGFPLSYCLLSTATAIEIGKRTKALTAWATCLRDKYGVSPVFAHVDKDMAEISMLREVWKAKIQLCWWHLRKAVRERLAKSKLTTTPYDPQCAHTEFPFIDVAFVPPGCSDAAEHEGGTLGVPQATLDAYRRESPNALSIRISIPVTLRKGPTEIPSSPALQQTTNQTSILTDQLNTLSTKLINEPSNASSSTSRLTIKIPAKTNINQNENGQPEKIHLEKSAVAGSIEEKRTFCELEYRETITDMMERHFCAHPLIPGYSHPSPTGIREWAVKQMYDFCVKHDLREAWAYLWENWYRPLKYQG